MEFPDMVPKLEEQTRNLGPASSEDEPMTLPLLDDEQVQNYGKNVSMVHYNNGSGLQTANVQRNNAHST